ncbi:MAG: ABC transporter transmembrane domain-containing protein [Pseudomonadota bacterium]
MSFSILGFVRKMVRPYHLPVFIMVLSAIGLAVQTSLLPYILKVILDRMATFPNKDPYSILIFPAILYLIIYFTHSTTYRLYNYFVEYRMIPEMRKRISTNCINHLLKLSHQFYQNNFAGSLGSKVSELVMAIPDSIRLVIDKFISTFLVLTIAIFTLSTVNPSFALILILWALILLGSAIFLSKRMSRLAADWAFKGHL